MINSIGFYLEIYIYIYVILSKNHHFRKEEKKKYKLNFIRDWENWKQMKALETRKIILRHF